MKGKRTDFPLPGRFRVLVLLALLAALSSCTALDPVEEEADSPDNGNGEETERSAEEEAEAALPPTTHLGNDEGRQQIAEARERERQRLIDEINRQGERQSLDGYRETPPTPQQLPENDVVELNYEQADLREILNDMADALDISIVVDPSISEQVSIRTAENRPLNYQDIWPLMRLLTREAGVAMERVGNVYYIRYSESRLPMEISTPDRTGTGTASVIMQITPVTYVSVSSAIEVLNPLVEPEGRITRIGNRDMLAITANESQLSRINELLRLIDADPFRSQGIQLYQLSSAGAGDVAEELRDVLSMIEGDSPAYQIQALERINAVLVTAPAARGFSEITRWVNVLDADDEEQVEQLFRYRVRNLNATELATTLTEVFRREDGPAGENGQGQAERRRQEELRAAREELLVDGDEDDDGEPEEEAENDSPAPQDEMMVTQVAVSADLQVSIVADDSTNTLLIRASPRDYRQLLATINELDAVPLQVMINAAIAQITLTDDTAFGVDWSQVVENLGSGSARLSTSFLPSGGEGGGENGNGRGGLGGLLFNRSFLDGEARINATLEAIATNNEVRLLARPSLTVVNNMEGLIRIGAEVPVQLGETIGAGGQQTTNIQYRPTGIELFITPRINDDGVVNLTIRQELSSVSEGSGVQENPIFQNQEIETTVVARNGENVVLGGLIQDDNDRLNTGIPGLSRVPGLGRLFSFQRDNNERQELFIVLRPEIINLNERDPDRYEDVRQRFERVAEMMDDTGF